MTPEAEIRRRIREQGPITFAQFMGLALFWPQGGYYLSRDPIGADGDYYTSPLVHPAFGALLAVQLCQMWELLERPAPFTVAELGAGAGQLALDIMDYSRHLPGEFGQSLRYLCLDRRVDAGVDTSPSGDQAPTAHRITAAGVPLRGLRGCILSNELLDAFPVHQVAQRQGRLQEVFVTLEGDALATTLGEPSTPKLAERLQEVGVALAEGQTAEINLALEAWTQEVSPALDAGFVLTIDYGHLATELYSPVRRPRGALVTYHRHLQTDAPLRNIGGQDITAQVDFTALVSAGRRAGLAPLGFTAQRHFLDRLGMGRFQRGLAALDLPHRELEANRAALVELARPGGLGDFKVLAQGKNVGQPDLWGFAPGDQGEALLDGLPVPLLTKRHLRLLEGRYPPGEAEVALEGLWGSAWELGIEADEN